MREDKKKPAVREPRKEAEDLVAEKGGVGKPPKGLTPPPVGPKPGFDKR